MSELGQRLKNKFEGIAAVTQIVTAITVVVSAVFVWQQVRLISSSFDIEATMRDRPAIVFLDTPTITVHESEQGLVLRLTFPVSNQGSGNAYAVMWRVADQVPPLHSGLLTREDALSSYASCRETFRSKVGRTNRNIVLGAGMEYVLTIDHPIVQPAIHGPLNIRKYIAAFYESESGYRNVSYVGVNIRLDKARTALVVVENAAIVLDPRRNRR